MKPHYSMNIMNKKINKQKAILNKMKKEKFLSIFLTKILIISIIAFSYQISAQTGTQETPEQTLERLKNTKVGDLSSEIERLDSEKANSIINHIKENINKENFKQLKEISEIFISQVIRLRTNRELTFSVADNAKKINDLSIEESLLSIDIAGKEFNIDINELPNAIKGIGVTQNGISYLTEEGSSIETNNPEQRIVHEDGNLVIEGYKSSDGEEKRLEISFSQKGRVTFRGNGEIEFSGGAVIYDPATQTRFELKDKEGAPGYLTFYKEGHIIKTFERSPNPIVVRKEKEDLIFEILRNPENGVFIISKDGIDKENYNDYPRGFTKEHSFLIDPEGKKIFVAENKESIYKLTGGKGYRLFGDPDLMHLGGVLLDGTTFRGRGGGGFTPPNGGGTTIPPSPPGGPPGGGIIGKILPFLLIGGGILLAILLLTGGSKGEKKDYSREVDREQRIRELDDLGYNVEEPVTTGEEAPITTETGTKDQTETGRDHPVIQSPYS